MDDDCDDGNNKQTESEKKSIWEHFEVADNKQHSAICKVCSKVVTYRSCERNLWNHFEKHGDSVIKGEDMITKVSDDEEGSIEALETLDDEEIEEVELPKDKRKHLRSPVWNYFEIHDEDEKIATCNFCKERFSYRTSATNLNRHLKRKHYALVDDTSFLDDDEVKGTPEQRTSKAGRKRNSIAWVYFTVADSERRIAKCKLCARKCSYLTSVTNLMKHVERKHNEFINDEDFDNGSRLSRKSSPLWLYFKCIDDTAKISVCLICKAKLSHTTSTGNLKRHLYRKHPNIKLKDSSESKQMLVGSDGQLYEIDETDDGGSKMETLEVNDDDDDNDDDNNQSDPMELNAVYLDDVKGSIIEPERKRNSQATKRKRRRLHDDIKDNDSSSDEEITFKKRYVKKKLDRLDQFGKYLVSLLKELPKELSNQLQADFVKQVMAAELSYNSQKAVVAPSNGYAITITETKLNSSNDTQNVQYVAADGGVED